MFLALYESYYYDGGIRNFYFLASKCPHKARCRAVLSLRCAVAPAAAISSFWGQGRQERSSMRSTWLLQGIEGHGVAPWLVKHDADDYASEFTKQFFKVGAGLGSG